MSFFKVFEKEKPKKKVLIKEQDFEIVFTDISKLDKVKNWEKNRPADQVRVEQIKDYYVNKNSQLIPGILCIWKKNDNELYIYDGLHRYLAAKKLDTDIDMKCIVKYHYGCQEDIIIDFENINRSVSLPILYLEENNELKRKVCETIANKLCNKYPDFVSPSRKPHRHNFNRDVFIDFLSGLDIDFTKKNIDVIIYEELIGLNYYAKNFVSKNKIPHPNKCDYHKFYLFYLSSDYIKQSLESHY